MCVVEALKRSPGPKAGQLSLEFYQRRRTRWPFPPENIPWEVIKFKILVKSHRNQSPNLRTPNPGFNLGFTDPFV
jgi:autophagy-related protein 101